MAADIMLRSIIVIIVARESSIVLTQRRETCKIRHFSTNLSRIECPISNATSERASKHGGLDLTEQTDQKREHWTDF